MIIDSHAHIWRRTHTPQPWIDDTMAAIDRDFWVDDLRAMQRANGVIGSVVVQSSNTLTETVDLLTAAAADDAILGVVGWIDLEGDVVAQVTALQNHPGGDRLVGVRHLAHQDPDPDWLERATVHRGLEELTDVGLVLDVVVRPEQLPGVARTLAAHPELPFVLDHLGKPPVSSGDLAGWRRDIAAIAQLDHAMAKLSGIPTEARWADWSVHDVRPIIDTALDLFGPDRLVFGSDWPVVDLARGLPSWIGVARELVDQEFHPAVFRENAIALYRLEPVRA